MLTKRRIERLKAIKPDPPEILQWRCKVRQSCGCQEAYKERAGFGMKERNDNYHLKKWIEKLALTCC